MNFRQFADDSAPTSLVKLVIEVSVSASLLTSSLLKFVATRASLNGGAAADKHVASFPESSESRVISRYLARHNFTAVKNIARARARSRPPPASGCDRVVKPGSAVFLAISENEPLKISFATETTAGEKRHAETRDHTRRATSLRRKAS